MHRHSKYRRHDFVEAPGWEWFCTGKGLDPKLHSPGRRSPDFSQPVKEAYDLVEASVLERFCRVDG